MLLLYTLMSDDGSHEITRSYIFVRRSFTLGQRAPELWWGTLRYVSMYVIPSSLAKVTDWLRHQLAWTILIHSRLKQIDEK